MANLQFPQDGTGPEPADQISDEVAGTGGMLRAAAQDLRQRGKDPHKVWWFANDIDPVAVAALAVNAHLWDLGPNVVLGCVDVLAEPDWTREAIKAQARELELRRGYEIAARYLVADLLLTRAADELAE
jgi:hypothetical protein